MDTKKETGTVCIYYSLSDILLGTALMILVVFFINDYLSHRLGGRSDLLKEDSHRVNY